MREKIIVKAWSNKKSRQSNPTYGIRISKKDRDKYINKDIGFIDISMDEICIMRIIPSNSFWNKCSEIRSKEIGKFLIHNGIDKWEKGNPPTLILHKYDDNCFHLELTDKKGVNS